jgi:hypothetical protein
MSLNQSDIAKLVGVVRGLCLDLQTPVAIADQTTFLPVLSDLRATSRAGVSTAAMAALVNRFYREHPPYDNMTSERRPTPISET